MRISISLVLLIFLFKNVDSAALVEIIRGSDKSFIILAFLVWFFGYLFCYLRWKMILETIGINLPAKRLISAFSGGIFFNMFLPSTVGGDFVRSVDVSYHSKKTNASIATVLLDRLSGFAGSTIVALSALIFGAKVITDQRIILAICFLAFLFSIIALVVFNNFFYRFLFRLLPDSTRKIWTGLRSVFQEMHEFKRHKAIIAKNLLLSIAGQVVGPVMTYILAISFHLDVNIVYFFLFIPIIGAVTLLPISIGGLGVRDYMTILLFSSLGISKHFAFAFSLMTFFFLLICAGIGGLIYGFTLHNRRV